MSKTKTIYSEITPPPFEWPEFKTDLKRIKSYSKKYSDKTIAEAFSAVYGVKVKEDILKSAEYQASEYCNTHSISIGDIITVTVESVSRHGVELSYHNSKQPLVIKQNLNGRLVPGQDLRVSVIEKTPRGEFVVDCIDPLYQDWINKVSSMFSNTFQSYECRVRDLVMQKGGYTGKIEIETISKLIGKPYYIDAFIPGSQITLNIENDFSRWDGETVDAMITNFTQKNGVFSAACSRKKLLNVAGGNSLVNLFDMGYGQGTRFEQVTFEGTVLGVLNSAKKQGVFVEVPEYSLTGFIEKDPKELVKYHKGDVLNVQIDRLDWDPKKPPYRRTKDGILTEVNLKPVFVEVAVEA